MKYPVSSCSILITSVLNCVSDRLAIFLLVSCIFFWRFELFFHLGLFFFFLVSVHQLCSKRWNLRYSPGRGNPHSCGVMLYVGEGSKREQCHLLLSPLVFSHFPGYPQSNWAFLMLIPGGWVCVRSRPLWVSPVNSPVRLGVSPTSVTPTGFFS